MSEDAPIELTPENSWCPRHLEHFRKGWPKGYVIAQTMLFTAFCGLPDVLRYCGLGDDGNIAQTRRLQAAIGEFGPMCCAVDAGLLLRIINTSRAGDPMAVDLLLDELREANRAD